MIATIAILVAINLSLRITSCNMGRESMKASMYKEGWTLKDEELVESYQENDQGRVDRSMQKDETIGWNMKAGNRNCISQKNTRLHGWHMKAGIRKETSQKEVSTHKIKMSKNSQEETFLHGWFTKDGNRKEISQKEVLPHEVESTWNITTRMKNKKNKNHKWK